MSAATLPGLSGQLLLGGPWRLGAGADLRSAAPADGRELWAGREADAADVDAAVAAAVAAFPGWRRTPLAARIALVRRFAELVQRDAAALALLIAHETGKPLWDARGEVTAVIGKAQLSIAAQAERTPTREQAGAAGPTLRVTHRPHGAMAVLGPFNFPAHLPNGHVMPALLAGNTVILKPSEQTPATGEAMARLWVEAGAPAGVVNLVQGGRAAAQALAGDERVAGVLFTGGVEAGLALHRQFAGAPHRMLALELGGNNPLVVWDVADAEAAARIIARSAFVSSGQRCTCARRLIVDEGEGGARVVAALTALMDRLVVGAPDAEPQPFMGPLISAAAAERALQAQAARIAAGARPLKPMRALAAGPAFLSPGLIDVTGVDIADEEVFAPLLQLIRAAGFGEAIAAANDTRFGLAAGLVSDDPALFARFDEAIAAGVVNWNRPTTGASGAAPFGGVGLSGNHRPAGYYAADYVAWPAASLVAAGPARDDEPMPGLADG